VSSSSEDPAEPGRAAGAPVARAADHALIGRAAVGDRAALDQLLRIHQSHIYGICLRMMGNEPDARDATQEAMIAVCRGLGRFDRRSALSTWVYRVTTNACLDELRRRARRPVVTHDGELRLAGTTAAPDDAVTARLTLDAALARLPDEFRAALVLRDLCELDYAEIAEVLAIPAGTVRSRISRARLALARDLGNQDHPDDRPTSRP
jgi:RNA polymerase sigma-70 factor, ECF subfamily